jgi:hypothetical protein
MTPDQIAKLITEDVGHRAGLSEDHDLRLDDYDVLTMPAGQLIDLVEERGGHYQDILDIFDKHREEVPRKWVGPYDRLSPSWQQDGQLTATIDSNGHLMVLYNLNYNVSDLIQAVWPTMYTAYNVELAKVRESKTMADVIKHADGWAEDLYLCARRARDRCHSSVHALRTLHTQYGYPDVVDSVVDEVEGLCARAEWLAGRVTAIINEVR